MADDNYSAIRTLDDPSATAASVPSFDNYSAIRTLDDPAADKANQPHLTSDTYDQEVAALANDDSFWELPYQEKRSALQGIYLGPDKKGERNWEDDDEILDKHKQLLADLREYDGIPMTEPKDYEKLLPPPPALPQGITTEDAYKSLDAWEQQALAHAKLSGGVDWREIEDVATRQIQDRVDQTKQEIAALNAYGEDPNVAEHFYSNVGHFLKGTIGTFTQLLWEDPREYFRRAEATSTTFPDANVIDPQVLSVNGYELTGVSPAGISEGIGSGAATVGSGAVADYVVGGRLAVATLLGEGARLGYVEGWDRIYQKTGDADKAQIGAWENAGVQAMDTVLDGLTGMGVITRIGEKIGNKAKAIVLTQLGKTGILGDALPRGFKIAGDVVLNAAFEGGEEMAQEVASGAIFAAQTGDPSEAASTGDVLTAGISGAIVGGAATVAHARAFRDKGNDGGGPGTPGNDSSDLLNKARKEAGDIAAQVPPAAPPPGRPPPGEGNPPIITPYEPAADIPTVTIPPAATGEDRQVFGIANRGSASMLTREYDQVLANDIFPHLSDEEKSAVFKLSIEDRARSISSFLNVDPYTGESLSVSESAKTETQDTKPLPTETQAAESTRPTVGQPAEPTKADLEVKPGKPKAKDATERPSNEIVPGTKGVYETASGQQFPYEIVDTPLSSLAVEKDIPNVKDAIDERGLTKDQAENVASKYDDTTAPIFTLVKDVTGTGEEEVSTGRYRTAVANADPNKTHIRAVRFKESEGMTIAMARAIDAEKNIQEGQGEVRDYVEFFREEHKAGLTEKQARAKGIKKGIGNLGWAIGVEAAPNVRSRFLTRNPESQISAEAAATIANAAPITRTENDAQRNRAIELQEIALGEIDAGRSPAQAAETIKILQRPTETAGQTSLPLPDVTESGIRISEREKNRALADAALEIMAGIKEEQDSARKALKEAKHFDARMQIPGVETGTKINDPVAVNNYIKALGKEFNKAANWQTVPEMNQRVHEMAAKNLKEGKGVSKQTGLFDTVPPSSPPVTKTLEDDEEDISIRPIPMRDTSKPDIGTSPLAQAQVGESEVTDKERLTRNLGLGDLKLSDKTLSDLGGQRVGEYIRESHPEARYALERFMDGKDAETLVNQLLDRDAASIFGEDPSPTIKPLVLQYLRIRLQELVDEAEKAGDIQRSNELQAKLAGTSVEYVRQRTSAGQGLAIGNVTRDMIGGATKGEIEAILNDMVNNNANPPTRELQNEILENTQAAEDIDRKQKDLETEAQSIAVAEREQQALQDSIIAQQEDLRAQQNALEAQKTALAQAQKELEKADKKQRKELLAKIAKLQTKLDEMHNLFNLGQEKLQSARERFARVSTQLKDEIAALRQAEKTLKRLRKEWEKKERVLRRKRFMAKEKVLLDTLPRKTREKLRDLAEKLAKAPDGMIRQKIAQQMINEVLQVTDISPADIANTIWYANALLGLSTQGINAIGSVWTMGLRTPGYLARNPSTIPSYLRSVAGNLRGALPFTGASRASTDFASVLSGQEGRSAREHKFASSTATLEHITPVSALESLWRHGFTKEGMAGIKAAFKKAPVTEALTGAGLGKFGQRLIRATDAFAYRTAFDAMAAAELSKELKNKGLSAEQIASRIAQSIYLATDKADIALQMAEQDLTNAFGKDGYSERDVMRRAMEITDATLPENVRLAGERWGDLVTLTQTPEGLIGLMATGANKFISSDAASFPLPFGLGRFQYARPFLPFVNIVANLTSTGLEFSPAALARVPKADSARKVELVTNAIVGSALAGIIASLAYHYKDKEDPEFMIYGPGTVLTPERRKSLYATGYRPNTFKIGKLYVPYAESPLFWFSAIGNYFDNLRWNKKFDEKTGSQQLGIAFAGIGDVFREQSVFQGLTTLSDMLSGDVRVAEGTGRYFSNFTPGGGFARDMDRIFNAEYQETITRPETTAGDTAMVQAHRFLGAMWKNYPVVGDGVNQPMLNAFGEVLKPSFEESFGAIRRSIGTWRKGDLDAEWEFLAERGLNFSGFPRTVAINSGAKKMDKIRIAAVKKRRAETLGRAYTNLFTPEERQRFVQIAGPKVKEAVRGVMLHAGTKSAATLQGEIDKAVTEAKAKAKLQLILGSLSRR